MKLWDKMTPPHNNNNNNIHICYYLRNITIVYI